MRLQLRNLKTVYYCTYSGKTAITDSDGYETGEYQINYSDAESIYANVSAATGESQIQQFGSSDNYDKVLILNGTPDIDENTVFFIDKDPEYTTDGQPVYDYKIYRIAKSLNEMAVAVSKVKKS